jgi:class 3 adenylate cyclase
VCSSDLIVDMETSELAATRPVKAAPAERRQLTIASCELLVGAVAATTDPEDLSEIIQSYHSCVVKIAGRHNALVANTHSNTAIVYFGYPQAREDDPERAVGAALELVAAVTALRNRPPLQTRIGIATGLVVVGDTIDAGGTQQRGIIGETPDLAARLQAIAEPDTVVIAANTLPDTPALCRTQIKCQIGLTYVLMRTRGYAASETKASLDQARALIKRAEAMGEPPEDPLLLFLVLHGFWVATARSTVM